LSKQSAYACDYSPDFVKKLFSYVPFELTLAQKKSLYEILEDLKKPHPTSRLLQGDVGSGKTIVAAIASLVVADNQKQSVFMAPTEVLARQHYETFKKYFQEFPGGIALLTSAQSSVFYGDGLETLTTKKELISQIKFGQIKIIIGTHAVIQKGVIFKNPAFIIVDEQHRFGVRQRAQLVTPTNADLTPTDTETDSKLLYKDLTYNIRGIIFKVKKELGLGHKESIYQQALEKEFKKCSIKFEREKSIDIKYGGDKVGTYRPDFIVEDKIIIELKALPSVGRFEMKQIWHYLKLSKYRLALLVNFGREDIEIKRIIYGYEKSPSGSVSSQAKSVFLPHFLSMSATPIPRTLALAAFGDLDLSIINELPKNRKPIITKVVTPINRQKAYDFIAQQIKSGRQAFVICPRIEPADPDSPLTGRQLFQLEVKSVKQEYEKLSKKIFPHLRIAMLHGKMKSAEKQKIMRDFKDIKHDILVSTSVVEVGVDVPNATIMMIEGSEHFGLSQLYQFRGRVGRGQYQSFCFLFSDISSRSTNARMKALVNAKNGFELAEIDLKLRGPGQFLGQEQAGMPDLAMKAIQNPELVKDARESAFQIIQKDPLLENHPYLAAYVKMFREQVHLE
jgi:ATP-dependent DNA helicase RecG